MVQTMTVAKLEETKGAFKVIGKVTRIDKDGAYKEEQAEKGKRVGETFRSLRFGVKTSETNEITVSMFDYEPEEVFLWNSEKRKEDENYKGEKIPFDKWENQQEELREQGFAVLQTRVGVTYKEDGKIDSKGLPSFVASEMIFNNIDNGDSVIIEGTIRYSTYQDREGKTKEQKTYKIEKLHKIKDVDFEDEKFEEVSYFEQKMVFVGVDVDKREGKAYVTGRIIDYYGKFQDSQFIVNMNDADGKEDEGMKKLADTLSKKVKFGDVINVFGDTINRVVIEEAEDTEEKDPFAEFGGKSKPKHAQTYTNRTYINEMSIYGVDAWDKGVYKEEDFIVDELVEDAKENPFADEFGGKGKKNPFDSDGEISEDDLPF